MQIRVLGGTEVEQIFNTSQVIFKGLDMQRNAFVYHLVMNFNMKMTKYSFRTECPLHFRC